MHDTLDPATGIDNSASDARYFPYPDYKNSNVEDLHEIPVHWKVEPLKRVCTFKYGDSLRSENRKRGDIPVYGSNGAVGKHKTANTLGPCLVIGRKGSFGSVNYCPSDVFVIDTAFYVDRMSTNTDIRWLYYVLSHIRLDATSRDSAIPGLDREDAYARTVALCDANEQRAIACFLDREAAKLDALVAKKERLIELLMEKRNALITSAVTTGLDVDAPMKDSGVDWLGKVPDHWDVKQLRWAVRFQRGHDLPSDEREEGSVPVVSSSGVSDTHSIPIAVAPGIVTGRYGTIGQVYLIDQDYWPLNTTLYSIELYGNEPRFLMYMLSNMSSQFLLHSVKSAVPGVDRNDIHADYTAVPPLSEQRAIAAHLDKETEKIDDLVVRVRDGIDRLKDLRTALISAAVTGKIDVRETAV